MRPWPVLLLGCAFACAEIPPANDPLAPRPVGAAPVAAPAAPTPAGPDGYTFEDDTPEEGDDVADVAPGRLAEALGLDPGGPLPASLPKPAAAPAEPVTPSVPVPVAPAPAKPDAFAMVQAPNQWGVRLVSTVPEAQPPRAILGLADGSEQVVKPGSMIQDAGVVVLAIGRDQVQIATVKPAGDHAEVETSMLRALNPGLPPLP